MASSTSDYDSKAGRDTSKKVAGLRRRFETFKNNARIETSRFLT